MYAASLAQLPYPGGPPLPTFPLGQGWERCCTFNTPGTSTLRSPCLLFAHSPSSIRLTGSVIPVHCGAPLTPTPPLFFYRPRRRPRLSTATPTATPDAADTTITSGPAGSTIGTNTASFGFSSRAGRDVRVQARRRAPSRPAPRRSTVGRSADGSHTFSVRATDAGRQRRGDAAVADLHRRHDRAGHDDHQRPGNGATIGTNTASFALSARSRARPSSASWTAVAFAACTSPSPSVGRRRRAHVPGPRQRRGRQRLPDAGEPDVHGRHRRRLTRRSRAGRAARRSRPRRRSRSPPASPAPPSSAGSTRGAGFAACTSPRRYSGARRRHAHVRGARDGTPRASSTPRRRRARSRSTPPRPDTTITTGRPAENGTTPTFAFTATRPARRSSAARRRARAGLRHLHLAEPTRRWPTARTRSRCARSTRRATSTPTPATQRSPSTRPRRTRRSRRARRARPTTRRRRSRSPDEAGATFECRLDGGRRRHLRPCSSPHARRARRRRPHVPVRAMTAPATPTRRRRRARSPSTRGAGAPSSPRPRRA